MNDKISPDHPTVKMLDGEWLKMCALIMFKLNELHIVISREDIAKFSAFFDEGGSLVVIEDDSGLHLRLLTAEAVNRINRGHEYPIH